MTDVPWNLPPSPGRTALMAHATMQHSLRRITSTQRPRLQLLPAVGAFAEFRMSPDPRFPALQDALHGTCSAPLHRTVRVPLQRGYGRASLLPGKAVLLRGSPRNDRRQADGCGERQATPVSGRAAGGAQQRVHRRPRGEREVSRAEVCCSEGLVWRGVAAQLLGERSFLLSVLYTRGLALHQS